MSTGYLQMTLLRDSASTLDDPEPENRVSSNVSRFGGLRAQRHRSSRNCEELDAFDAEWYAVSAAGARLHKNDDKSSDDRSSDDKSSGDGPAPGGCAYEESPARTKKAAFEDSPLLRTAPLLDQLECEAVIRAYTDNITT
jgi:hypothetical protein